MNFPNHPREGDTGQKNSERKRSPREESEQREVESGLSFGFRSSICHRNNFVAHNGNELTHISGKFS